MKKTQRNTYIASLASGMSMMMFFALPSSTNYGLDSYGFGAGGTDESTSTNYSVEGILGETSGDTSSTNYESRTGLLYLQEANVPPAATFTNDSNWYNKLHIVINKDADDPSDATYAIAISDDDFVTTQWVQNDNTIGSTLGIEDFQTYSSWGGATGEDIIGLSQNTTYKVKVKSRFGNYTESPLGPEASASTSTVSITFDIDVSSTDSETASPYTVDFGDLTVGSVNTATDKVWIDLSTNAESGAYVFISSANSGLKSTVHNYTISSLTGDLSGQTEGFGVQGDTVSESSGGPFAELSPYDGASDNVGIVDTTIRDIYSTSGQPITSGRASFLLKTKVGSNTPSADDYAETLTIITAGTF